MKAPAERTGSPDTEKRVKRAQEKLSANQLPPALTLRRYAALSVAADRYMQAHEIAAGDALLTVAQLEGEEYGIDGRADPDAVRRAHGRARKIMSWMAPKVLKAARALRELNQYYRDHESALPASVKRAYPPSKFDDWYFELHSFSYFLWPAPLAGLRKPKPEGAGVGNLLRPRPRGKFPKSAREIKTKYFGDNVPEAKPLSNNQVCLLWWAQLTQFPESWSQVANLVKVWGISDTKDPKKKPEDKDPRSLQRHIERLQKQHSRIPEPLSFMWPVDRELFLKP